MTSSQPQVVLITGCSTGIGKATAVRLASDGMTVYATARRLSDLAELAALGCQTLELDVNSEASMAAAVEQVLRDQDRIDALVNNAGYSLSGAIEDLPLEKIRQQFDTNVFGLIQMCQLVLPAMREQGRGRIVNIGSMGGRLTFPGGGAYHATKYAVEAISDALRFEVKDFGVDVVLVEPGLIRTDFAKAVATNMASDSRTGGVYDEFNEQVLEMTERTYENPLLGRLGGDPEVVADVIAKALSVKRPRARYAVTPSATLMIAQRKFTPDRLWDKMLTLQLDRPKP